MTNVIDFNRVHVMDEYLIMDLVTLHPQVATFVADNNFVTNLLPFPGSVELLVDVTIESERCFAYARVKSEVLIPLFECV